jgi:hypothetical protein
VAIEAFTYRLNARGRPAGRLLLRQGEREDVALIEARMQLQGPLGNSTHTQFSRSHRETHQALVFRESSEGRSDTRPFEVQFDPQQGTVRAQQGRTEAALAPYLLPYRDPLSLLRELRTITRALASEAAPNELETRWRIPMLGKDVTVSRHETVEVDVQGARQRAMAYTLHPGGSMVFVSLQEPFPIVRLLQRLPDGWLEATLVEVGSERTMTGWDEVSTATPDPTGRGASKRRGRRRRRGRQRD